MMYQNIFLNRSACICQFALSLDAITRASIGTSNWGNFFLLVPLTNALALELSHEGGDTLCHNNFYLQHG